MSVSVLLLWLTAHDLSRQLHDSGTCLAGMKYFGSGVAT